MGWFFYVIAGFWGLAVILNLMTAARICYAIEERSGRRTPSAGLPGYASIIPVAFNYGVASDEETQDLRWQMNKRLIVILLGFAVFYFLLSVMRDTPAV